MNFPSTNQSDANNLEFEVTLDEAIEPASASPQGDQIQGRPRQRPRRNLREDPGGRVGVTTKSRRRHTAEFQANAVRRLNNPGQSVQELADELKVTRSLLYRWRLAASTKEGPMPKKKPPPMNEPARRPQDWTTEQKLSVVLDAQGLAEEELGGFLRQ
jgi:transposase-like protein